MKKLAFAGAALLALMNVAVADQKAVNECAAPYGDDCFDWRGVDGPDAGGEGEGEGEGGEGEGSGASGDAE